MSTPTADPADFADPADPADPADFAACADHQCTYPIGGSCPECDADEARELAKRWAAWHTWAVQRRAAGDFDAEYEGPWDPHGEAGSDRERLSTWVRERVADWLAAGVASGLKVGEDAVRGVLLLHVAQDLAMSLVDCEALIDAAKGWPS